MNNANIIKRIFLISSLFVFILMGSYFLYNSVQLYKLLYYPPSYPIYEDLTDLNDNTLGHYYLSSKGEQVHAIEHGLIPYEVLDKDGILMVNYDNLLVYKSGITGKKYNPGTICWYALEIWENYLKTNGKNDRDNFIKYSDWLINHLENGKWYYHFDNTQFGIKKPWASAFSQSLGISVLLRAYQLTNDQKYLNGAKKAFDVMALSIEQGGVLYRKNTTSFWFEEFPNVKTPVHSMNGHIWALFGILDFCRVTHSPIASELFQNGINALKSDLYKYDTGYWALYDQKIRAPLKSNYFEIEIHQLNILYVLTKETIFLEYALKFKSYQHNKKCFIKILFLTIDNLIITNIWNKIVDSVNNLSR